MAKTKTKKEKEQAVIEEAKVTVTDATSNMTVEPTTTEPVSAEVNNDTLGVEIRQALASVVSYDTNMLRLKNKITEILDKHNA